MKKIIYEIKPGIILLSADDEYLLVATSAARENGVPHVKQLNGTAAFYWEMLEREAEEKEKIILITERLGINKIHAVMKFNMFKEQLYEMGYLAKKEVDYEKN